MKPSPYRITPYQQGDEHAIIKLFSLSYPGRKLPLNWWYWRFRDNPNGHGVIALAWHEDKLIGQYSIATIKLWINGKATLTGLAGTTMTHPDYRGQGLFTRLNEEIHMQMRQQNMPLIWSFPNDNSHRLYVENVDRVDIYEIPIFRLLLADSNLTSSEPNPRITLVEEFDARFDNFWQTEYSCYNIIAQRNSQTLQWRYSNHPTVEYQVISYHESAALLQGYAVFKRFQDEYQVVDILAETPLIGAELVLYIIQKAFQDGLKGVSLWLNVNQPLHRHLEKMGFRNGGHVTYFTGRILLPDFDDDHIYTYRNWYLTMGDSDVF